MALIHALEYRPKFGLILKKADYCKSESTSEKESVKSLSLL